MAGAPKPLKSGRQKKKAQAVRERWPQVEKATVILIPILAASIRLRGITSDFPVLTDEAIYMRWAEIIEHQNQWFIALLDGKQPLSYWLYALLRFAGVDPLLGVSRPFGRGRRLDRTPRLRHGQADRGAAGRARRRPMLDGISVVHGLRPAGAD